MKQNGSKKPAMPQPRLIINADGFGFSRGINRAIRLVAGAGSISSISVTPNFPAFMELFEFHRQFPQISVGVHLNPVVGRSMSPCASVPTLLNREGLFWYKDFPRRLVCGLIDENELFRELLAQVEAVQATGIAVTHLDSHQNLHLLPRYFSVFLRLAKEKSIGRMRCHRHYVCGRPRLTGAGAVGFYAARPKMGAVHLYSRFLMAMARKKGMRMADRLLSPPPSGDGKDRIGFWHAALSDLPGGTSEVYCHPAFPDETLMQWASYVDPRQTETYVLLSSEFAVLLKQSQARLIGFHDL
jgi:predicted glycoside hydrolase/deacetylase ChbG (UPF0249 family)